MSLSPTGDVPVTELESHMEYKNSLFCLFSSYGFEAKTCPGVQWVSAATLKGAFEVQNVKDDSKGAQSGMAGLCIYVHSVVHSYDTQFNQLYTLQCWK